MKTKKLITTVIILGFSLFPAGISQAEDGYVATTEVVCASRQADGSINSYLCPDVVFDTFQTEVTTGSDQLLVTWYQPSRTSRMYWGPSYAKSTEIMYLYYLGQAKAAGNIYNGLRIVQVCAWYTRSGAVISEVACSNASSDTGQWVAGYVANTSAWDDINPDAPKTYFNFRLGRIDPSIY